MSESESVPVLRGLPIVGVAPQLHKDPIEFFSSTLKRYGDRVELRVLGRRILLLSNPADVEAVLIQNGDCFGKSAETKNLRAVFGDGLYSSDGERWRKQRRVIQPAFQHDRVVKYSSMVVERMSECSAKWQPGEAFDFFKEMLVFTSAVICEVIFGREQSPETRAVAESVPIVFENLRAEVLYLSLWRRLPLPRSRRWNRAIEAITSNVNRTIARRRSSAADHDDLLDLLMQTRDEDGEKMSDEYVHDEIITMFVAGQETSAVALSWAVALLAQHPDLQEEAAAEVKQATNGRDVLAEDYPRLVLLNAIVQESLRLYPPLWMLSRTAIRDTSIGELPVRAGTAVWINSRQIQRDDRWFSDPDRFDPSRWINPTRRPKFSHLPFGGGSRNCVAQHFATAEVVLGLAVMLSRFRIRLAPGAKIETDAWLSLRPKYGVPVVVEARSC